MKIRTFLDENGQVAGVDASAGKKGNKRFRKRFSLLKNGSIDRCRKLAEKWIKTTEEAKESEGLTLVAIPQEIRPMVIRCLELLEDYPATLEEAVLAYIHMVDGKRPLEQWTYTQAADDWLEQKKGENRRAKYTAEMTTFIKLTKREFGSKLCDQIATDDLRKFIRDRDKTIAKKTRVHLGARGARGRTRRVQAGDLAQLQNQFQPAVQLRHPAKESEQ